MTEGGRWWLFEMEIKGAHIWGSFRLLWRVGGRVGGGRKWVSEAHSQREYV